MDFFYHHGFSKQNIKFVTVKHFYALTVDVNNMNNKKLVLWCTKKCIYTTIYHGLPENHLVTNSERFP